MNVLDENVLADQREQLEQWHVRFRQIGTEIGRAGMGDDEIIPLLLTLRGPTLFSVDGDFYKRHLCHPKYCLVNLDVRQSEAAIYTRRVLQHDALDTEAKRMGLVVNASPSKLRRWRLNAPREIFLNWTS